MAQHSIPIENISKVVVVSVGGSLYLNGWNQDQIRIKDLSEEDLIKTKKDRVEIHSYPSPPGGRDPGCGRRCRDKKI